MTRQQHLDRIRLDLLDFASQMVACQESDCAIALLQVEQALTNAQNVLAENGIDLDEEFFEVKG
jgi:hypothetical protein